MADKWSSKVQFPQDNFVLLCTEESFGPSKSSGKPMITLKFEVHAPQTANIAGTEYVVAGVEIPFYTVTKSINADGVVDEEKQENVKKRLNALYAQFGLPEPTDLENPTLGFKGKKVWALLSSDKQEKRKAPTAEQAARGEEGEVITNPITGQPLINYWPRINEIFGLAPE